MKSYKIENVIIDEGFRREETVTADIKIKDKMISISYNKSDLEVINTWAFKNHHSIPVDLSDELIDSIRADIKKMI
ncbi:hypothetical protein [Aquibacillus kalidii]|uniref:hypothetical protein n=1 Tax=Aquibacillus kalidii TaxID=2762597 RepID=UPI0016496870|nr:hypothetical protein [Aquibacillus kalidii]